MSTLSLEVATPLGLQFQTEATEVELPSVSGEFGVLPGHVPVLASLRAGVLRYESGGKVHVVAVGAGFTEADSTRVRVLTDVFALPEDIDRAETEAELKDATKALAAFGDYHSGHAYEELQRAVDWAQA
ncbi:MAG: ATP synthase F1 subunit epsilon, partial [Myxococcota bacterium]